MSLCRRSPLICIFLNTVPSFCSLLPMLIIHKNFQSIHIAWVYYWTHKRCCVTFIWSWWMPGKYQTKTSFSIHHYCWTFSKLCQQRNWRLKCPLYQMIPIGFSFNRYLCLFLSWNWCKLNLAISSLSSIHSFICVVFDE